MARININLGTPPSGQDGDPVRTAFEKTNTMFTELYKGNDAINKSGWGTSTPIQMSSLQSADDIPQISGVYIFGNGGVNIPYPFCYVTQYASGTYVRQVARSLTDNSTWERQFAVGTKNTKWTQNMKVGDFGLGLKNNSTYIGNMIDPSGYRTAGTYFAQWNLAGLGPVLGTLTVEAGNDENWLGQTVLNHDTGALFTRGQSGNASGAFTPWRRSYNDQNSQNDPQSAAQGLMSAANVNGWIVEKYLNGNMVMFGTPVIEQLPANGLSTYKITIPNVGWAGDAIVVCSLQPYSTFDYSGTISAYIESPTSIVIAVKNGGTAQQFASKIMIKGRWK